MAVNTYRQDEKTSDVSNFRTLVRTLGYLQKYRFKTIASIAMILVQTLIVAVLPMICEYAVEAQV